MAASAAMPSAAGPPTHRRSASGRATMASPSQRGNEARDDVARAKEEEADPFQEKEERSSVRDRLAGDRRLAPEENPGVIGPRRLVRVECPAVEAQETQRRGDRQGDGPAERLPGGRSDETGSPGRGRSGARRSAGVDTRRGPVSRAGLAPSASRVRISPGVIPRVRHPSWPLCVSVSSQYRIWL